MTEQQNQNQSGENSGVSNQAQAATAAATPNDLETVRSLILQAHPDVVPELVKGGTIGELHASIEPAKTAYQRVADRARAGTATAASGAGESVATGSTPANSVAAQVVPPVVPAGATAVVINPDTLPAAELIRRGVQSRNRNS